MEKYFAREQIMGTKKATSGSKRAVGRIAIFPGTFDPITLGHLDIVDRGRKIFDEVIVAIGKNPEKDAMFPLEERLEMIRKLVKHHRNVSVEAYSGLTVEFVKRRGAVAILRGLRNMTDMDFESRIALTNRRVADVETIFIMTREDFGYTSSSLIKQIVTLGGDPRRMKGMLPKSVIDRLIYYRDRKLGAFAKTPTDSQALST